MGEKIILKLKKGILLKLLIYKNKNLKKKKLAMFLRRNIQE